MTKFGRVIGKTRWSLRIRLDLGSYPDASCGVAGRIMDAGEVWADPCPAGCAGCGPASRRPPVIEIPLAAMPGEGASFNPGERVRIEFSRYGTALSVLFGLILPILAGIAAFFALSALSRVAAYFAGLATGFAVAFALALLRQRTGFLPGATVFPA
jgi:hypothetical protein